MYLRENSFAWVTPQAIDSFGYPIGNGGVPAKDSGITPDTPHMGPGESPSLTLPWISIWLTLALMILLIVGLVIALLYLCRENGMLASEMEYSIKWRQVRVKTTGRRGFISAFDNSDLPYRVDFSDGVLPAHDWFAREHVEILNSLGAAMSPRSAAFLAPPPPIVYQISSHPRDDLASPSTSSTPSMTTKSQVKQFPEMQESGGLSEELAAKARERSARIAQGDQDELTARTRYLEQKTPRTSEVSGELSAKLANRSDQSEQGNTLTARTAYLEQKSPIKPDVSEELSEKLGARFEQVGQDTLPPAIDSLEQHQTSRRPSVSKELQEKLEARYERAEQAAQSDRARGTDEVESAPVSTESRATV